MPSASKPSSPTVLEDLPFYIARAALSFRRFNDRSLRLVGLKPQAPGIASVLHALEEEDHCTVNSLVERTHLPNGTLTGLLDQLEKARCIQRVQNAEDGRSWRIRLTLRGRTLCRKLQRRHRMVMDLFAEVFSAKETAALKELLGRITDRMRAFDGDAASPAKAPRKRPAAGRRR